MAGPEAILTKIRERLGLKGFSRVLLDSFSREEFERLIRECNLETGEKDSGERKALGLANLISSQPQMAADVFGLLDEINEPVRETILQVNDEDLLSHFSPQNAEMDVLTGRLLWVLLTMETFPACQKLLRIWVDFLERPARAPELPEEHAIDENQLFEAERRAVASFAEDREESPELSDEALEQQRELIAEEESPAAAPKGLDQPLDRILEDLNMAEPDDYDKPPVRSPAEESLTVEPTASRDEPSRPDNDRAWQAARSDSEEAVTPPVPADASASSARTESLLESVVAKQETLGRHLEQLENRLDELENLSQSLKQEIETVKSEEEQLLGPKIEQIASLLVAVREQTRMIESRLEEFPSADRPGRGELPVAPPAVEEEHEEVPEPEVEQIVATAEPEVASAESLAEEPTAESVPADEPLPPAEVSAGPEEELETFPIVEEEKRKVAEISAPGEETAAELEGAFSEPVEQKASIEPIFQNETIVIVGGHDHLAGEYQALIEGLGGRFERYASVDEFSLRWLEDLTDRAYLVIAMGNVATQRGVLSLLEVANRLWRRLLVHHSTAPASLHRFLVRLVEGGTI